MGVGRPASRGGYSCPTPRRSLGAIKRIERKLTEIVEALGDDALLTRLLIARAEAADANPSELAARAMTSLKRLEPLARSIVLRRRPSPSLDASESRTSRRLFHS